MAQNLRLFSYYNNIWTFNNVFFFLVFTTVTRYDVTRSTFGAENSTSISKQRTLRLTSQLPCTAEAPHNTQHHVRKPVCDEDEEDLWRRRFPFRGSSGRADWALGQPRGSSIKEIEIDQQAAPQGHYTRQTATTKQPRCRAISGQRWYDVIWLLSTALDRNLGL